MTAINDVFLEPGPNRAKGILVLGQSNALGRSTRAEGTPWPEITQVGISGAMIWNDTALAGVGEWQIYEAGVNSYPIGSSAPWWGPEAALLYDLIEEENLDEVYCMKLAVDASSLGPVGGSFNEWHPDRAELYPWLMNHYITRAAAALPSGIIFEEVYWVQGETDATIASNANNYLANLRRFRTKLRLDLGNPDLQFYISGLHRDYISTYQMETTIVRNNQISGALEDGMSAYLETFAYEVGPDRTHYTASGYIGVGHGLYGIRL